jgi:hypothetical protein
MLTGNNAVANPAYNGKAENTMHRRSNWDTNPREGVEKQGMTKKSKEKQSRRTQMSGKMEVAPKTGNTYL